MSLIEVILARKEVLISLIVVGLVLLSAIGLAVLPGLLRRWKKIRARRQAARAARLAEAKRAATKQKRGRKAVEPDLAEADEDDEATEDQALAPAAEKSGEAAAAPTATVDTEAAAEADTEESSEADEEKEKSPEEAVSAMQDILDSVFVDEDVTGRYDVLLEGIEVGSAEELVTMANQIAAELGINRRTSD